MEIPDMNHIVRGVVTQFIGGPNAGSGLYASPRHPKGETLHVVVAPGAAFSLKHRGPSKLPAPNHKRLVEHSPLL